jgi:PST family polysaccharide transporter
MAKGAVWMVAMRLAIRFIGIISTIILARLLVPSDFGLVAMATMIYGFIEIMGEFGFDVVLIQKQNAERDYYDTAWTLSIIRGLVTSLMLFAGAGIAADFFGDQRLVDIIYVLCLVAFVAGFANIGIVDFRKAMTFGKDFQYIVSVKLCSFVVTIVLAFMLRTYWALVIGVASSTLAQLGLSYFMHPFRPRWSFARWREVMNFSKWLVLNNILIFASGRGDSLIVGKILGAATLGLYTVAYEIATMATSELVAPIRRALLPGYAKLAHDPEALRRSFVDGFALIVMIATPIAVGIGLVADPLVRIFLGDKWLATIPMLQPLAIFGLLQILSGNSGPVYLATGRPQFVTIIAAIRVGMGIPLALFATLEWGVTGAIWSLVATSCASTIGSFVLIVHLLGVSPGVLVMSVWRSAVALCAMVLFVRFTVDAFASDGGTQLVPLVLGSAIVAGAVSYIGTQLILWWFCGSPRGPERQVIGAVTAKTQSTQ